MGTSLESIPQLGEANLMALDSIAFPVHALYIVTWAQFCYKMWGDNLM